MADWSLTGRRTRFNSRLNKRRRNEIKVKEEKRSGQKASWSHSGTVVSSVLTRHSVSVTDARLVPQFVLVSNWFWLFELQQRQLLFCLFNLQKLNTHFHSSVRLLLSSFSFHLHSFSYIFPSFLFSYSPENSLFWLLLTLLFLHFQSHDHFMWLIDRLILWLIYLFVFIYYYLNIWCTSSKLQWDSTYVTVATLTAANMTWLKSRTAASRLAAILLQVSSPSSAQQGGAADLRRGCDVYFLKRW